jgi:hypothetical protein
MPRTRLSRKGKAAHLVTLKNLLKLALVPFERDHDVKYGKRSCNVIVGTHNLIMSPILRSRTGSPARLIRTVGKDVYRVYRTLES